MLGVTIRFSSVVYLENASTSKVRWNARNLVVWNIKEVFGTFFGPISLNLKIRSIEK